MSGPESKIVTKGDVLKIINSALHHESNETREIKDLPFYEEEPNANKKKHIERMRKTSRLFFAGIVFVLAAMMVISFYGVIISNGFFFAASMLSYAISPLYHGLCEHITNFIFSTLQVVVNCPFIQFYMLFTLSSIYRVVDFIPSVWHFACMAYYGNINEINNEQVFPYESWRSVSTENWKCELFLCIVSVVFFFGLIAFIIVSSIFGWTSWYMPVLGVPIYLVLLLQVFWNVCPTYVHCWRLLFGQNRGANRNVSADLCVCVARCTKCVKRYFPKKKSRKKMYGIQTKESAISCKIPDQTHLSDNSDDEIQKVVVEMKDGEDEEVTIWDDIRDVLWSDEYKDINKLSKLIVNDHICPSRHRLCLVVSIILNVATIAWDIFRAIQTEDCGPFIVSIVIRFLASPVTSYFHMLLIINALPLKDQKLQLKFKGVMWIGSIFTMVVVVVSLIVCATKGIYTHTDMISQLNLPSTTQVPYTWNHADLSPLVCAKQVFNGTSILEIVSFSLGVYHITKDKNIFNSEMQHFFGANWKRNIDYSIHWINEHVPIAVYYVKDRDMTVVAFRGFDSGQEVAIQIEMWVIHYVLPVLEEILPLNGMLREWAFEGITNFMHRLGMYFFDPTLAITDMVNPILDIYETLGLHERENVIFTGANVGGLLAKIAGTKLHRHAVGFISFPAFNDFFQWTFDLEGESAVYITNVYNYEGLYTDQEPSIANNIGIPWVPGTDKGRDNIYQSFCTIVETCRMNSQYEEFCRAAIGNDDMDIIKDYFSGDVFDTHKYAL